MSENGSDASSERSWLPNAFFPALVAHFYNPGPLGEVFWAPKKRPGRPRDGPGRTLGRSKTALGATPEAHLGALRDGLGPKTAPGTDLGQILGRFGLHFGVSELAFDMVHDRLELTAQTARSA